MTANQKAIISFVHRNNTITIDEAVKLVGANIYANKKKHVGATLSRMVNKGIIKRIKKGIFAMPYYGGNHER